MIKSVLFEKNLKITYCFGSQFENWPDSWEKRPQWQQVHQTRCVRVDHVQQSCGEADGLYTFQEGIPIGVYTADCLPILMAKKEGLGIAAVHAGWRGIAQGIVSSLWKDLMHQGEHPQDWVAVIGPAIGPCCYCVDQQVANQLQCEAGRVDLPALQEQECLKIGFGAVEILRFCTFCCQDPLFYSFRRNREVRRQYSWIVQNL